MAKSGTKATLLNIVSRNAADLVEVLNALQPLLDTATNEADAKFDVQAGQICGRLLTLSERAKVALRSMPDDK